MELTLPVAALAEFTTPAALSMGALGVVFGVLLDSVVLRPVTRWWVHRFVRPRDDG